MRGLFPALFLHDASEGGERHGAMGGVAARTGERDVEARGGAKANSSTSGNCSSRSPTAARPRSATSPVLLGRKSTLVREAFSFQQSGSTPRRE